MGMLQANHLATAPTSCFEFWMWSRVAFCFYTVCELKFRSHHRFVIFRCCAQTSLYYVKYIRGYCKVFWVVIDGCTTKQMTVFVNSTTLVSFSSSQQSTSPQIEYKRCTFVCQVTSLDKNRREEYMWEKKIAAIFQSCSFKFLENACQCFTISTDLL